ncbi:MAG: galactose mutarotase [Bacteroidales bacterium]|nr:galactose mutarotase [Bacteroidales bacterium]
MRRNLFVLAAMTLALFASCDAGKVKLLPESAFKTVVDGKNVDLYTIKSGDVTMQVTNYGARVVTLWTPDRNGNFADIETGYENIDRYVNNTGERFLGAAVGPVANRIANGRFTLDGQEYTLPQNNNGNTLHGGDYGVDRLVWDVMEKTDSSIVFLLNLKDGQEGFPGDRYIIMGYTLDSGNNFTVQYLATTDKPTPVNFSHHSFFNLSGDSSKSILDYELWIKAGKATEVDSLLIPTGRIVSLDGSPLDFRTPTRIGDRIDADDYQIKCGPGYDHNWIIDREGDGVELVASVYDPESGRLIEVFSDQPGLQFYSGNFFFGEYPDKYGNNIGYRCSMALETQKFPDAVNHPEFPDTILGPGQTYTQTCVYRFSVK